MSNEIAKQNGEDKALVEKKKESWGNFGIAVHNTEIQLQFEAQKIIAQIKVPQKIEEVPGAEAVLKDVRSQTIVLQNKRKEITRRFDEVSERLSQPEKSITDPYKNCELKIIALKKEKADADKLESNKQGERNKIKENALSALASTEAHYKQKMVEVCQTYFEAALEKEIKPGTDELDRHIFSCKRALTEKDFTPTPPVYHCSFIPKGEGAKIVKENFIIEPAVFIDGLAQMADLKFFDYAVAFSNKQEALVKSQEETKKGIENISAEAANKTIAAKLEASSAPVTTVGPEIKALKESFEIDMPENVESATIIMSAFVGNLKECLPKLKVNKWFSLSVSQMANALGKMKSEDNAFQYPGLVFKKVEKL